MNIQQLKYFCAVCQYGSLSEASKNLHISQPSLSSVVKELENEFGVVLFQRHYKGMSLTSEGEKFFSLARDITERTEFAYDFMINIGKERKKIKLGIPPMIGSLFISKIYNDFIKFNSEYELEIIENGSKILLENLDNGYVDMAFITHNHDFDSKFNSYPVTKLEVVCCVSNSNPMRNLDSLNLEKLENIPVVLFENSFFQTQVIKNRFRTKKIDPKILMQTSQLSTMISLIENDVCAGFMFRQLADKNKNLVCIPFDEPMFVDVSIVWNKDIYSFRAMKLFMDFMKTTDFNSYDNIG